MDIGTYKWGIGAVVAGAALIGAWIVAGGFCKEPPKDVSAGVRGDYALDFRMKRIDGTEEDLNQYKGKVVLIVNVASKCGLTPQYEGLQKLSSDKKDAGLVVLGFPANNFMGQEPGTNEEIKSFCDTNYKVTFPMFEKVSVKGDDTCDLYKLLTRQEGDLGGAPDWNFAKWILDRDGKVAAHFKARIKPTSEEFVKVVDALLAEKAGERPAGGDPVSPDGAKPPEAPKVPEAPKP